MFEPYKYQDDNDDDDDDVELVNHGHGQNPMRFCFWNPASSAKTWSTNYSNIIVYYNPIHGDQGLRFPWSRDSSTHGENV